MSEQELAQTPRDNEALDAALEGLRRILEQTHPHPGDIVADARAERERQSEEAWRDTVSKRNGEP